MVNEERRPPVIVTLKSSSQKDGKEGYEISATSEATMEDVTNAVVAALFVRQQVSEALAGPSLAEQLAASLKGMGTEPIEGKEGSA